MSRILSALALCTLPSLAGAQTVDEVIARHLEARGGVERIKAMNSQRMNGRITVDSVGTGPFALELERPNKMRVEFALDGKVSVQAFDGERGWLLMPTAGITEPRFMPPGEPKEFAEQADIDGPLLDYKAKGARADLVGKVRVGAGEAWKLRLTLRSGHVRFFYIDTKSGHLVRAEERRRAGEGELNFVNTFSDHRKVQGFVFPFRVETAPEGGTQKQVIVFEVIEVGVPIENDRFAVPAGAKPMAKPAGQP